MSGCERGSGKEDSEHDIANEGEKGEKEREEGSEEKERGAERAGRTARANPGTRD